MPETDPISGSVYMKTTTFEAHDDVLSMRAVSVDTNGKRADFVTVRTFDVATARMTQTTSHNGRSFERIFERKAPKTKPKPA